MNRRILFLVLIVFVGFILRFWNVGNIPPGLNRDEASIGYTSFSILTTGKDEYGEFYPLSFKSFGDWKLPLYIYINVFSTKFFGLNEWSVRLPSVIFGTLTILGVYFLSKEIFKNYYYKEYIALISSFFLAISPWHLHFSRVASEANLSVFLIVIGLFFFFKGLNFSLFIFSSSVFLALTLYTYHGSHVFTPIFFIGLLLILFFQKRKKIIFFLFIIPFVILGIIIYQKTFTLADKIKFSGLSYFSDEYSVYEKISLFRIDHFDKSILFSFILHNKITFFAEKFIENYLKSFSTEFLFIKGGGNLQHNIPHFGNLYAWEFLFIILGFFFLFQKQINWRFFLLFWFLISAIPAAITRDAPHSARMLSILPLPHIISAFGFVEIVRILKERNKNFLMIIATFILLVNFVVYLDKYFIHFPKITEVYWGGGYKDLVSSVSQIGAKYSKIVMDRPDYSPYIYFLFYQKINPATFQNEVIRYPEDSQGFQHVKSFANIEFKKLDWSDDLLIPGRLLISWAESTPPNATNSSVLVDSMFLERFQNIYGQSFDLQVGDKILNQLVKVVKLKNGISRFYLIEVKKNTV